MSSKFANSTYERRDCSVNSQRWHSRNAHKRHEKHKRLTFTHPDVSNRPISHPGGPHQQFILPGCAHLLFERSLLFLVPCCEIVDQSGHAARQRSNSCAFAATGQATKDRKSTRLNSSHG